MALLFFQKTIFTPLYGLNLLVLPNTRLNAQALSLVDIKSKARLLEESFRRTPVSQ